MIPKARWTWLLVALASLMASLPDPSDAATATRRPSRPESAPAETVPYYGEAFYRHVRSGIRDHQLKNLIRTILESAHVPRANNFDAVMARCPNSEAASRCYGHRSIGYDAARMALMGELHGHNTGRQVVVRDVYCEREYATNVSFAVAPPVEAKSRHSINTEHTWPQSRFSGRYPTDLQKSDLHHLFPTDAEMNSIRGNYKFAEVDQPARQLKCPIAKFGRVEGKGQFYFEPPVNHKGNVARALFYFSIRYQIQIDADEEEFLRRWNRMDPVDVAEFERNEEIMKLQGNRNPFVDHPQLADRIADF